MDTIFALASARGKAGVAVVRISGPQAHAAVASLCALPQDRRAAVRKLVWRGEVLDQVLVIIFAAGHSFTDEAMAELHLHGSLASTAAVSNALIDFGLRIADPGEFTRRALENGKLDLSQVEGLADLIDAETEVQRRQAMGVFSGSLRVKADTIKAHLVRASALVAALIDFSDEELPGDLLKDIMGNIEFACGALAPEIHGVRIAERIRDGFEVAIIGAPNVGKSTLLNVLAGRDAAITSSTAGTTRDVIEVRMDIGGLAVTLLDTAGLRETDDPIEAVGVERARQRAAVADLRLVLVDDNTQDFHRLSPGDLLVRTKADLGAGPAGSLAVSALTGQGVAELIAAVSVELSQRAAGAATATRQRHRVAIEHAWGSLESARTELEHGAARLEIAAEHLRAATRALDSLVGRVDVEDLLDQIFSSFCIGK